MSKSLGNAVFPILNTEKSEKSAKFRAFYMFTVSGLAAGTVSDLTICLYGSYHKAVMHKKMARFST